MGVRKKVEQEYAKTLFVDQRLTQKEIAERLAVSEKTVGKWVKQGEWEKLRTSLLTTKDNQITALYRQLETLNNEIATRPIVYDVPQSLLKPVKLKGADGSEYLEYPVIDKEDYPIKIGNVATAKDADIISKITKAIKQLETETSIGETVEVLKQIIQYVRSHDSKFAMELTKYADAFISDKMKG